MTDKPTASEGLGRTWNSSGALNIDPDTLIPGKVSQGWTIEKPPAEFLNWIQKFVTQYVNHSNEEGIAIWDTETEYPLDAYAKGSDGNLYRSVVPNNQGNDPTTEAEWVLFTGGGALTSDDIGDDSVFSTANVTEALDAIAGILSSLSSDEVANASSLSGTTISDTFEELDSSDVANVSSVGGATVTEALDNLSGGLNVIKSAFTDFVGNSTLADPDLQFAALANTKYRVMWRVLYSTTVDGAATDNCSTSLEFPTATVKASVFMQTSSTTLFAGGGAASQYVESAADFGANMILGKSAPTPADIDPYTMDAFIETGANAGVIALRFNAGTDNTIRIHADSLMKVEVLT